MKLDQFVRKDICDMVLRYQQLSLARERHDTPESGLPRSMGLDFVMREEMAILSGRIVSALIEAGGKGR